MEINKTIEEQIVNFGAFKYSDEKMASILNVPEKEITKMMKNDTSDFYRLYQKGIDTSDYVLDLKLFEMAKAGDIKALEKWEQRTKAGKMQRMRG